jgi:uncharacterized protein (DUF1501 family)
VKPSVGVYVGLDKVGLTMKGVEAQALLKARLEQVRAILDKALTTIGESSQILVRTVREFGGAVREAVREGGAMGWIAEGGERRPSG